MNSIYDGRLLVVDDNEELCRMLTDMLHREGFRQVYTAGTCAQALSFFETAGGQAEMPDLVILDINLPDGDGFSLMQKIRMRSQIPVLFLSARDEDNDRLLGLGLGADDYMTKPFAREELMARVEACLRRTGGNFSSTHYKFRNMEVNYVNKMMTVDGNYVPMNRKTYEILELLVRNKEIIMTKQQIFDRIWGYYSTTGTSVIEINIFRLRKILSEYGLDVCLKTIKATGYMWTEKI